MRVHSVTSIEEIVGTTSGQDLRRRIFGHHGLVIGSTILVVIMLMALLAPLLAPQNPYEQNLLKRFVRPIWSPGGTWEHPLGTDHLGRDYLSRLMYGARISLLIGFTTTLISGFIGTALGIAAGYFGGRVDMFITFVLTVRLSIPLVLVSLAVVAIFGGSLKVVVCILGLLLWDRYAVVLRSATMQIRAQDYVTAAKTVGCSTIRIIFGEIMPNILNYLAVVATLEMARAILLEAALSFLGMGVPPPLPSWGLMVSDAKDNIFFEPWVITIPGLAIFILVISINLLGDGIRDVTAPEGRS